MTILSDNPIRSIHRLCVVFLCSL